MNKKSILTLICSIVLFLLFVSGISYALAYPFDKIYANSNQFQIAFLGASETEWGINPILIDSATQKKSCLYATSGCTYEYRQEMLRSLLQQDSMELVVIEVSYGSMKKNMDSFDTEYKVLIMPRISGFGNKVRTVFSKLSFWEDEFEQAYAQELFDGSRGWRSRLNGIYPVAFAMHGYVPQEWADQYLTPEEAAQGYNSESINTNFREKNLAALAALVRICKEQDTDVMLITMPLSESYIWRYDGWDEFHDCMTQFSEENEVLYYDFNLWTKRQQYLSDDVSYRDEEHLCDSGANEFSRILGRMINQHLQEMPVDLSFYDSYTEAKEHSVYNSTF